MRIKTGVIIGERGILEAAEGWIMVERDLDFEDPVLQRKYEEAMERMGPSGRVERTLDLLVEMYRMLAHVISLERPEISQRELRRLVALKLYQGDEMATKRLKEIR